jgi:hypothetical protein
MELRIWLKPSFKTVAKESALAAVLWPAIFFAAYAAWPPGPELANRSDRVAAALDPPQQMCRLDQHAVDGHEFLAQGEPLRACGATPFSM